MSDSRDHDSYTILKRWGKKRPVAAARKVVVFVLGFTVILIGIALTVLPGPAFVVIPAGLAILSLEFAWARRWLRKVRDMAERMDPRRGHGKPEGAPEEGQPESDGGAREGPAAPAPLEREGVRS